MEDFWKGALGKRCQSHRLTAFLSTPDQGLPMLARSDDIARRQIGLASSNTRSPNVTRSSSRHCHWRDVLALTWRITTINSGDKIARELCKYDYLRPASLKLAPGRFAPRHITRAGVGSTEAIFIFETAEGRGNGVLKSVAWGRNREHNGIQRSPERNRTAAEMSFSTAC